MRKSIIGILLTVGALSLALSANAQSIYDLKINEIMLTNTDNYVDDFGNRGVWIEVMNTAFNKVNIGNCYVTNDINNPTMYRIPYGDPVTNISQRHFVILFADNENEHGPLHTNFVLDSTHRFFAIFSPDGKSLIDSVTIPLLAANKTYCRMPDGAGSWKISEVTTPYSSNDFFEVKVSSGDRFKAIDPYGIIMAITAMSVVFLALLVLYRLFRLIGNINQGKFKVKRASASVETVKTTEEEPISGEVFAAISAALYQYENDKHDQESEIVTIERVSRRYSPWSSKFYNLRQMPEVRRNKGLSK